MHLTTRKFCEKSTLGEFMEFCPKCGNLMNPEKREGGVVLVCSNCGYEEERGPESKSYKVVREGKKKEGTTVIEEEQGNLPTTSKKCPKCGHEKAYWWMQQTRGADEPTTRFYRCVKCGNTWREY